MQKQVLLKLVQMPIPNGLVAREVYFFHENISVPKEIIHMYPFRWKKRS
jgi:hypothetical protein